MQITPFSSYDILWLDFRGYITPRRSGYRHRKNFQKTQEQLIHSQRVFVSLVTTSCRKDCTFREREQEKEEEAMKMRVALCMTDVLMVLYAETLNALHGDIKP